MILNCCENKKSNKPSIDRSARTEEYIGNNKKYSIGENDHRIRIIGNGNKVYVGTNTGSLEIIGNSTTLRIINNCGSVLFTGNNGTVVLGSDSSVQSIKYVGCNGTIKHVSSAELLAKKTTKLMSSPMPLQTNDLNRDDFSKLFDRKFKKLTYNNIRMNNENGSTLNLKGFQVSVGNVFQIGPTNVVINRN